MISSPAARRLSVVLLFCWMAAGCSPVSKSALDDEKDPDFIAGKNRVNSMDYQGAVEAFEKALENNPRSAPAHFELGLVCYQNTGDFAGAIYHFRKFLELHPNAPHAENVNQFITVCKEELAKGVPLAPITRKMQQDLETLASENLRLKQQLDSLSKSLLEASNRLASIPAKPVLPPDEKPNILGTVPSVSRAAPKAAPPPPSNGSMVRRHVVKRGETIAGIARQYHINASKLLAANPGVIPKRLKAGQSLTIPPP